MWAGIGLALSLILTVASFARSKRAPTNYYASHVYGMTPAVHRAYAFAGLLFGAFFAAALAVPALPVVPVLGVCVLVVIFYFSSFARGFSDEE